MKLQGWEITLVSFGFDAAGSGASRRATTALRLTNIQSRDAGFTWNDFTMRADDGRQLKPAVATAQLEGGFLERTTLLPRSSIEGRVAFDIPPDAGGLVLDVLDIEFRVVDSAP